jgi:hypothetical protein
MRSDHGLRVSVAEAQKTMGNMLRTLCRGSRQRLSAATAVKKTAYAIASPWIMLSLAVTPARAFGYDWGGVVVHVTSVSPVGFPGNVEFTVDNAPSTCPGSYLFYFPANGDEATQHANVPNRTLADCVRDQPYQQLPVLRRPVDRPELDRMPLVNRSCHQSFGNAMEVSSERIRRGSTMERTISASWWPAIEQLLN